MEKTDLINPGQWFAEKFGEKLQADKILVQKSGYFARSAAANKEDLALITRSAKLAAEKAIAGESGVVGLDLESDGELSIIDFNRISGGKPFNTEETWFCDMLGEIGQE